MNQETGWASEFKLLGAILPDTIVRNKETLLCHGFVPGSVYDFKAAVEHALNFEAKSRLFLASAALTPKMSFCHLVLLSSLLVCRDQPWWLSYYFSVLNVGQRLPEEDKVLTFRVEYPP